MKKLFAVLAVFVFAALIFAGFSQPVQPIEINSLANESSEPESGDFLILDHPVGGGAYQTEKIDFANLHLPKLVKRQGGSATIWETSGTSNYTPTNIKMQAGVVNIGSTLTGATNSAIVTFPEAFDYEPLVLVSAISEVTGACYAWVIGISTAQVQIGVKNEDAGTQIIEHLGLRLALAQTPPDNGYPVETPPPEFECPEWVSAIACYPGVEYVKPDWYQGQDADEADQFAQWNEQPSKIETFISNLFGGFTSWLSRVFSPIEVR